MRERVTFVVSVGLNLALGGALVYILRFSSSQPLAPVKVLELTNVVSTVRTNVLVRRQNFSWREIESPDYPVYIANLRKIGCPEATVQDIIISEVNQLYAAKRATNVVTADQQWWRSEPDLKVMETTFDQLNALETERRAVLAELLGPGWEKSSNPTFATFSGINLNGPILGTLSAEARKSVLEINARGSQRIQVYLQEQQKEGRSVDPAELARLREKTRGELGQVLTPTQLEEYQLRYSQTASSLRSEFRGMDLSPDEFRALFHASEGIDQQLEGLAGNDPASKVQRERLEQERAAAMERVLGTEKTQLFKLSQNPVFQQAQATVKQIGSTPEAVMPLYEINLATEQERQRIRSDHALTPEEQEEAIQSAMTAQRKSLRQLLGEEAYQKYIESEETKARFLQPRNRTN